MLEFGIVDEPLTKEAQLQNSKQIFFVTKELADRWRKSARTLEGWRDKGIGPNYHRIGSSVRYHIDDIERFERAWSSSQNDIC